MKKAKKVVFLGLELMAYFIGITLNLMMEYHISFLLALNLLLHAHLAVKAYLILTIILAVMMMEAMLYSFRWLNFIYVGFFNLILLLAWFLSGFHLFLSLAIFGLICLFITYQKYKSEQPDTISEIIDAVVAQPIEPDSTQNHEEPEIVEFVEEETLDEEQQKEIDAFLDSLFETSDKEEPVEREAEEPLVAEILNEANDILATDIKVSEVEEIEKQPPREVVLKRKEDIKHEDDLAEALSEKDDQLGEFDEEIPLDDFLDQ